MIVPFAVRPMRLGIVIGHKALMGELRSLPTRHLLEMHLTHAAHHIKVSLDEVFPALTSVNILLLDVEGFTNREQLLRPKDSTII